jgi:hypothetical protein
MTTWNRAETVYIDRPFISAHLDFELFASDADTLRKLLAFAL